MDKIAKRIKKLPDYIIPIIRAKRKKDAQKIIQLFRMGIKNNTLDLDPLKPRTVQTKTKQGFKNPDSPLAGKAGTDERAYRNMLWIQKTKNGYTIRQSTKKHWKSKLRLNQLFIVHEYGTIIKRGKTLIKIPARPALKRAYDKYMNMSEKLKIDEIEKAKKLYIQKGDDRLFRKILKRYEDGIKNAASN